MVAKTTPVVKPARTHAERTKYANRKGIGLSTLARLWIEEHLDQEAAREAKTSCSLPPSLSLRVDMPCCRP
jgi:hypothetical protein